MNELGAKRLMIFTFYTSPWERATCWLTGIDRKTNEIVREVPDDSIRSRLADWCDRRDSNWRTKWARRWPERTPPHRWAS